ncbi:MAG TPA: amylo-alpha-1,6-glucosidase [Candidatus Paceibacterota bacterium]
MRLKKLNKKITTQLEREIAMLKDKRGFLNAGLPRFDRLFGRDALISAWQFLDSDPSIAKATLIALSRLQGKRVDSSRDEEPGKILHETYFGSKRKPPHAYFPMPYYGAVDTTPLYVIVFSMYVKKTGDTLLVKKYQDNLKKALVWILHKLSHDHFLYYQRQSKVGTFHQGWKDSFSDHLRIKPPVAIVEAQGYAHWALRAGAMLFESSISRDFIVAADTLKKRFLKTFYMTNKKYFALALDGSQQQRKAVTSNPGHLLLTHILDRRSADMIVQRLFQPDMWTPYGIRTHSMREPDFGAESYHLGSVWPHDNWMISEGLKKMGYNQEYNKVRRSIIAAYKRLGRLPEYYVVIGRKVREDDTACYPQAWATGALINFLSDKK